MEKIEGKAPVLDGLMVHGWATQAELAEWFQVTGRQIQNLEKIGLPSDGHRATKRYPVPHVVIWFSQYQVHLASGDTVDRLPFSVVLAEHQLFHAEHDARSTGQLQVRRRGARG